MEKKNFKRTTSSSRSKKIMKKKKINLGAENFPDANFCKVLAKKLKISEGDEITDEMIAAKTTLGVSKKWGTGFDKKNADLTGIEHFTALKDLRCAYNRLTSLDVSRNTALKTLGCSVNQLISLDVSQNTKLTKLYCRDNQLTSLDVSKNTALTDLRCSSNQLTSLDVSKNTALTTLWCYSNQLTSLDVSKNTALTRLSCNNNQLTSLDVSQNTALRELRCHSNQIKGKEMDALVASLPTVNKGYFYVINTKDENEGNVCTKSQVAVAKGKGWTVYDAGTWQEYEGSEDPEQERIVFKVPAGKGTIVFTYNGTDTVLLKVKIGNDDSKEIELNGKLKMAFPFNISEPTNVYIYASSVI